MEPDLKQITSQTPSSSLCSLAACRRAHGIRDTLPRAVPLVILSGLIKKRLVEILIVAILLGQVVEVAVKGVHVVGIGPQRTNELARAIEPLDRYAKSAAFLPRFQP